MNEDIYPGFQHPAGNVRAFVWGPYFFILQLRSGGVVRHSPADTEAFREWLCKGGAKDVVAAYEAAIGHKDWA